MKHIPVLCNELQNLINVIKPKLVVDCTFGAGGHTRIFLQNGCKVVAFDYDEGVAQEMDYDERVARVVECKAAKGVDCDKGVARVVDCDEGVAKRVECKAASMMTQVSQWSEFIKSGQLVFIHDNFANINKYIDQADFIFADIGLSSMQLDSQAGFSFVHNTELNMMSSCYASPLKHKLNNMQYDEIVRILHEYGELKNARKIARNICNYKALHEINTTHDLVNATELNTKYNRTTLAQVFQAFRIYNNDELSNLQHLMNFISRNRINFAVIVFHSLEARIVKQIQKEYNNHGFYKATTSEIQQNSRSASAIIRYGYNDKPIK